MRMRSFMCFLLTAVVFTSFGSTSAQTPAPRLEEMKKQIAELRAVLQRLENEVALLEGAEVVPPPPQPGIQDDLSVNPIGDPSGFRTVYLKRKGQWTRRSAKQGFTFTAENGRLYTAAAEGGKLLYIPTRVRDGNRILAPGWYRPEYLNKAIPAQYQPGAQATGDLSQVAVGDISGWYTVYSFRNGEYVRRYVRHAPDISVRNGQILTQAAEGVMNFLPYWVSYDGQWYAPGWYAPADPGDVVMNRTQ
jgi:hypothetical protein